MNSIITNIFVIFLLLFFIIDQSKKYKKIREEIHKLKIEKFTINLDDAHY